MDVVIRSGNGLSHEVTVGKHRLVVDEPLSFGGDDTGPTPYDLILAALGACTSMTLIMYARTKQWPLEGVTVTLRHEKIHAKDCAECETRETREGRIDRIERIVELRGPLSDEQRARLTQIADKCPVHRTLQSEVRVESVVK